MKRSFLNIKKKKANTVLNSEKLDFSPLRFATKQGYLLSIPYSKSSLKEDEKK